jgi:hypothetical protein
MHTGFRKASRNCGKKPARPVRSSAVSPLPKTKKLLSQEPAIAVIGQERARLMRVWVSVLRGARQDSDLTQIQIAQALGYTEDVISNIEALRTPISVADSILWAARCGLDEAELFERYLFALRKRKTRKRVIS